MTEMRLMLTVLVLSAGLLLQACSLGLPEDNLPVAESEPVPDEGSPYLLYRLSQ